MRIMCTARIYPRVRTTHLPTRSALLWHQHIAALNRWESEDAGSFNNLARIEFQAKHVIRSLGLWMSCWTRCRTDASQIRRTCVVWEFRLWICYSLIRILFVEIVFGWKIKLWLPHKLFIYYWWRGRVNPRSLLFTSLSLSLSPSVPLSLWLEAVLITVAAALNRCCCVFREDPVKCEF